MGIIMALWLSSKVGILRGAIMFLWLLGGLVIGRISQRAWGRPQGLIGMIRWRLHWAWFKRDQSSCMSV